MQAARATHPFRRAALGEAGADGGSWARNVVLHRSLRGWARQALRHLKLLLPQKILRFSRWSSQGPLKGSEQRVGVPLPSPSGSLGATLKPEHPKTARQGLDLIVTKFVIIFPYRG